MPASFAGLKRGSETPWLTSAATVCCCPARQTQATLLGLFVATVVSLGLIFCLACMKPVRRRTDHCPARPTPEALPEEAHLEKEEV